MGSRGLLGRCVEKRAQANNEVVALNRAELDITNFGNVEKKLCEFQPDIVVNCVAATNVDLCEKEKDWAKSINATAVKNLATLCKQKLIHISTDYVFDGKKKAPYIETDKTNPINYYGQTKLEGENFALKNNATVLRTQWLYSERSGFVSWFVEAYNEKVNLNIIDDCFGSPTNANNVAQIILKVGQNIKNNVDQPQLIHVANFGEVSWFEFAKHIEQKLQLSGNKINNISSSLMAREAKRPSYSPLLCMYKEFAMQSWENAFIKEFKI